MDNMGLWLVIGAAVVIAGICVMLLQKKAGEAKKFFDELSSVKSELERKGRELAEVQKEKNQAAEARSLQADELSESLESLKEQNSQLQTDLQETNQKLQQAEENKNSKVAELAVLAKQLEISSSAGAEAEELKQEVAALKKELQIKTEKLAGVEKNFEAQMEEVVQSSIQKITHAEQAKEEAIQAAQDNFEAAAEANAQLREKEALIKKLQG